MQNVIKYKKVLEDKLQRVEVEDFLWWLYEFITAELLTYFDNCMNYCVCDSERLLNREL